MIREIMTFLWESTPWWIKYPLIILGTPTALVLSFLSWHTSSIHAVIRPYKEVRDAEIRGMKDKLDSMDGKLDILILRGK
jgi:hypothetical protein